MAASRAALLQAWSREFDCHLEKLPYVCVDPYTFPPVIKAFSPAWLEMHDIPLAKVPEINRSITLKTFWPDGASVHFLSADAERSVRESYSHACDVLLTILRSQIPCLETCYTQVTYIGRLKTTVRRLGSIFDDSGRVVEVVNAIIGEYCTSSRQQAPCCMDTEWRSVESPPVKRRPKNLRRQQMRPYMTSFKLPIRKERRITWVPTQY